MSISGITPRMDAGFALSEIIKLLHFDRTTDLQNIQKILEMKIVKERLENLGFTVVKVYQRINRLSDKQIHQQAQNIDELRVGWRRLRCDYCSFSYLKRNISLSFTIMY